jgi:hypothetical protein
VVISLVPPSQGSPSRSYAFDSAACLAAQSICGPGIDSEIAAVNGTVIAPYVVTSCQVGRARPGRWRARTV